MNNLPKISIVTPSYNQGKFLRETIESVLNQDYPNLEYFIVDGGSTDNSVEIIKKYEDKIDWWVSEKDAGQSDALCKGFSRATGDLLGWLNSDDVYFPGALLKIATAYKQYPGASIYAGGIAIGEKGDRGIKKCSIPTLPHRMVLRYGMIGFGQQSSFFSARDYRAVGGLNRNLYMRMDGDIIYRLMNYNHVAVVIDDMVGFFRWHEATKSTRFEERYYAEMDDFEKALGISRPKLNALIIFFRLYKMVLGGYLKSWLATRHYKGMHMSEIWSNIKSFSDSKL